MSIELAYTDEQKNLRTLFIGRGDCCKSRACPACCPGLDKMIKGWERGRIMAERDGEPERGALKCTNCGYIRTFTRRKAPSTRKKPTRSQQRAINYIRTFFSRRGAIAKFEVTPTDYGTYWVSVETEGNVWAKSGGYFSVGRRGKTKCATVYDLTSDSKATAAHYDKMLA